MVARPNSTPANYQKLSTELNGPHYSELETSNLSSDFEIQQLLVSLTHVINLTMWIKTWGVTSVSSSRCRGPSRREVELEQRLSQYEAQQEKILAQMTALQTQNMQMQSMFMHQVLTKL